MKQIKVISAALIFAAVILAEGCASQNQTSTMAIPTSEIAETTAPEETTTAAASEKQTTIETTPEITPESSKEEFINALLGDGEVILEKTDEESGLYMKIVRNDHCMNTYIELPDYAPEILCPVMAQSIVDFTHDPGEYTSATFIFFDHNEEAVATSSINNYSGEWKATVPMMWYNDDFEKAWNEMMNRTATAEE